MNININNNNNIKGLSGLANIGNTCYINSCIQVLIHLDILNKYIDSNNKNLNNNIDANIVIEYKQLKDLLFKSNCIISPNRFVEYIHKISKKKGLDIFIDFSQQDVSEFFNFLIECFHNSYKSCVDININGTTENKTDELAVIVYNEMKNIYKNDYSKIVSIFNGMSVSMIKSLDNTVLSIRSECFTALNIPIFNNNSTSITNCLDEYTKNELMENDNAWFNEKTNSYQNVYKSILFWNLPDILIITLKRFNNKNNKLKSVITFPIDNLNLSKYIIGYNPNSYNYNLISVINHSGNCNGGHYYSYIKNFNNNWYEYNDTIVKPINISDIITNKAYCLIYKKN